MCIRDRHHIERVDDIHREHLGIGVVGEQPGALTQIVKDEGRLNKWPGCIDAVSYTHLDVYKRQGLPIVWDNTVFALFGPQFDSGLATTAIITIMPLAFATMIEHIGDCLLYTSSLCREPDELEHIYQVGRRDAEATLPALEAYLAG